RRDARAAGASRERVAPRAGARRLPRLDRRGTRGHGLVRLGGGLGGSRDGAFARRRTAVPGRPLPAPLGRAGGAAARRGETGGNGGRPGGERRRRGGASGGRGAGRGAAATAT